MDNHIYNLMLQIVQEHKSLWRIKNHYSKDAGSCMECQNFWKKMEKDKADHINELEALIKEHMK
ncbi:hypothetical protein C4553_02060 [Candidatus Parcubacteria bacterium]|nr:MAG: hypothetical protein C4553_02060 [Candidatus Parcubacteria bacterium]